MAMRIEALPAHHPGLRELRGAVLADELDPELQAISAQTCLELQAPTAAVSLVLEHVQLLRGYHGLAGELAATRATDRDTSFCQFVVRDQTLFEVNDAANDSRVPQELVAKYGVGSYLGAPLLINGQAVGAMCVMDTVPRMFSAGDHETIVRMAAAASRRLELLAAQPRERERALLESALRPAFGELRNRLTPVLGNLSLMQVALAELAAIQRLAQHVAETGDLSKLSLLTRGAESLAELQACVDDMSADTAAIARGIVALERASISSSASCLLDDVIEQATTLAHHKTKLVGGVRRPDSVHCTVRAHRANVISSVSAALSEIADALVHQRGSQGIAIAVIVGEREARVQLAAALDPVAYATISEHLRLLLTDTAIVVASSTTAIDLVYPADAHVVSAHGSRLHDMDRPSA